MTVYEAMEKEAMEKLDASARLNSEAHTIIEKMRAMSVEEAHAEYCPIVTGVMAPDGIGIETIGMGAINLGPETIA